MSSARNIRPSSFCLALLLFPSQTRILPEQAGGLARGGLSLALCDLPSVSRIEREGFFLQPPLGSTSLALEGCCQRAASEAWVAVDDELRRDGRRWGDGYLPGSGPQQCGGPWTSNQGPVAENINRQRASRRARFPYRAASPSHLWRIPPPTAIYIGHAVPDALFRQLRRTTATAVDESPYMGGARVLATPRPATLISCSTPSFEAEGWMGRLSCPTDVEEGVQLVRRPCRNSWSLGTSRQPPMPRRRQAVSLRPPLRSPKGLSGNVWTPPLAYWRGRGAGAPRLSRPAMT